MNLADLAKPFPQSAVHWRVQGTPIERNGKWSAMALAYIDARDVMDRLDEVCGPENWQTEYHETAKGRLICRLSIRVTDEWVTKSDGAGDTDVEGEKGAISDALKRAAVSWGIGRYLYRLSSPWVECEVKQSNGKTYWKAWAADPWAKVKGAPKADTQPTQPHQSAPKRDPKAIADGIIAAFGKAQNVNDLLATTADGTKAASAWDWLEIEAKEHAARVKAVFDARMNELTAKEQAA